MTTVTAILQARMSSTRLPGKVLKDVLGRPMLARQVERIRRAELVSGLVVATSTEASDDAVARLCEAEGVACFRGSLADVLERYYQCAKSVKAEHVMRLTADCPLTEPSCLDALVRAYREAGADFAATTHPRTLPKGLDAELFSFACLERTRNETRDAYDHEHVTPYMFNSGRFSVARHAYSDIDRSHLRWTVDYPEDLEFVRAVYQELYPGKPDFGMRDILALLERRPGIAEINAHLE